MSAPELDRLLPIARALREAGLSRSWFYRVMADPKLGPDLERSAVLYLPGTGTPRLKVRAFAAWLEAHQARPTR